MIYKEVKIVKGEMVFTNEKEIDQNTLTADCWMIQFNGLDACEKCEYKGKKDCGGKNIIKQLKNKKNDTKK